MTEQRSLAVITEMIDRAQNNIQKGSGTSMIFWGCFIAFIALMNVVLIYTLPNPTQSFWVWTLSILGFFIQYFIESKIEKGKMVKTHIDRIVSSAWGIFAVSVAVFLVIIFSLGYGTGTYQFFLLINPIILLLIGVVEYITAQVLRFKPFLWGAIGMFTGALLSAAVLLIPGNYNSLQFVVLAVCMILGFVIPGVQLNKKAKSYV